MPARAGRRPEPDDASPWVPNTTSLRTLAEAAAGCAGCDLHVEGARTVFGAGPRRAGLMLVGEQPGDIEDREGVPFVGPAGRVLDRALADAGIERAEVYLTNAVKHFHHEPRGKRRLHRTPQVHHLTACRPWLAAELAAVRPKLVVCLGAVAVRSVLGPSLRVQRDRGAVLTGAVLERADACPALITIHPSAVLRAEDQREIAYAGLVQDLRVAAAAIA
jgi:uracil-DNA glycosylase family protein